ncbi:MAG: type II secretion system F family protein [Zetaproteobacteria bacterium]|nr:type II secretion system F family protein [Zetaproteobacteria bacterium]
MSIYTYRGRDGHRQLHKGVLEADGIADVVEQLQMRGITPIQIYRDKYRAKNTPIYFKDPVPVMELILFCRQLHTMLKAGVPIISALEALQKSIEHAAFIDVLQSLRKSLDSGQELSMAMREHPRVFSSIFIHMVKMGEMTGNLDAIFLALYDHLIFEKDMKTRISSALRYPMFVMIAIAMALLVVNMFVIPAFANVFAGFNAELPLMTQILVSTSDWTLAYWPWMFAVIGLAIVAVRYWISTEAGRYQWDSMKLKIPVIGKIIFKASLARFARGMAMSYNSGIPMVQGLSMIGMVVDNSFMLVRIESMRVGIERGEHLSTAAKSANVFTPAVLQMIAIGEQTGDISGLMTDIAELYERDVDYEIKSLAEQIEPILIAVMGVLVTMLAFGIFLPIWDLGATMMHHK